MDSVIPDHIGQLEKPVSFSRLACPPVFDDSSAMANEEFLKGFRLLGGESGNLWNRVFVPSIV